MTHMHVTPQTYQATRKHPLNLSEAFGPTVQGEGPHAGALSSFIRLAGCNLSCSWCDSAYTWDWDRFNHREEVRPTDAESLALKVDSLPGRLIVTGGEPLLQATHLAYLLKARPGRVWDVETNGTRPLGTTEPYWDHITCSPKLIPSAGQYGQNTTVHEEIRRDPRAIFKFVIADYSDLAAADAWVHSTDADPGRVWLMPEGTDTDTLTARSPMVASAAVERGYNFSSRLHVYAWGDQRGH